MSEENKTTAENGEGQEAAPKHPNYAKAQWFALHALSGQETKVRESLLKRVKTEEMGDVVHEVVVPTERVSEIKRNKKVETERKLYPGYVFVMANLLDDESKIMERTWYYLRETPGVIGFADGERPMPMRVKEVEAMLAQMKTGEEKATPKSAFTIGDKVKVGDGPFMNQDGVVEQIFPEKGRLMVSVSMFGRNALVDLEFWQVEKV